MSGTARICEPPRLSALVVSYGSGGFALACARSLRASWCGAGRALRDLEIVVVDNASPGDEEPWLRALEREGARVVRARENRGYSGGLNLAFAHSVGAPGDLVALLNPDLEFLPGSLEPLFAELRRNPRAGAVAPLAFVDPGCTLALPPNSLPTPVDLASSVLAGVSPTWGRARAQRRGRTARRWWLAREPFRARMLSGACLLLRRGTVERLGGPMDERYPLYFEDTDLCRRLARAGHELVCVPEARVVHYWARSSGQGSGLSAELIARHRVGRGAYLRRWHRPAGPWLVAAAELAARAAPRGRRGAPIHRFVPLGGLGAPVEVELRRAGPFVVELGMDPALLLAAGAVGEGDRWRCPDEAWEWLFAGRYWMRALAADSGALLGAWTFDKATPSRSLPRAVEEERPLGRTGSAA